MKYLQRSRNWISIFVLAALIMTSFGIGFATPKAQACETGNEGLTPGWWKNHTDLWGDYYYPEFKIRWVYPGVMPYSSLNDLSMIDALNFNGGPGIEGAARILLRAAIAAALNADSDYVVYPVGISQLYNSVNEALAPGGDVTLADRETMLALADQLDAWNNLGVPGME